MLKISAQSEQLLALMVIGLKVGIEGDDAVQNRAEIITAKMRWFLCQLLASQTLEYFLSELEDVAFFLQNLKSIKEIEIDLFFTKLWPTQ
jgi:hypothetical protein